jgi:hypothetical protein
MAVNNRWQIKRKLSNAIKCLTNSQDHIVFVATPYENVHPEYFEAFSALVAAIEEIKKSVQAVIDKI